MCRLHACQHVWSNGFSWAPHSFWRACHLLHSKHSRQSKVSDPFAARREKSISILMQATAWNWTIPISEAMATVELHNRSADVTSPGCLAGYQKIRTEIATFSPFSPLRFLGRLGPSSERCRKFLRHLCMRHRSEDNDPVPRRTWFPGWVSPYFIAI